MQSIAILLIVLSNRLTLLWFFEYWVSCRSTEPQLRHPIPMKTLSTSITTLAVLSMASCSLPPSQAWRIVNSQGLFPYMAMEMGHKPFPAGVKSQKSSTPAASSSGTMLAGASQAGSQNRYLGDARTAPSAPATPAPSVTLYQTGPSTQGTRSGVTVVDASKEPIRSVNRIMPKVRNTARVSSQPSAAEKPEKEIVGAKSEKREEKPVVTEAPVRRTESAPAPKPVAESRMSAAPTTPKPVAQAAAAPVAKVDVPAKITVPAPVATADKKPTAAPDVSVPDGTSAPAKTPVVGTTLPKGNMASSAPAASAAPAPKPDVGGIPYGLPIPGRPGLVNSPFAGKLQIVDVSGLKSGQEVKCPFSGKLFLVP